MGFLLLFGRMFERLLQEECMAWLKIKLFEKVDLGVEYTCSYSMCEILCKVLNLTTPKSSILSTP
jgi:hypothetical protein